MSEMINRLGRLARSVINDFTQEPDEDYKQAWSELDNFLGIEAHGLDEHAKPRPSGSAPAGAQLLARDYANLEIAPGAGEEEIRTAYKRLLVKYHPDRFASDPEKQNIATEVTTKLNESYKRIISACKDSRA